MAFKHVCKTWKDAWRFLMLRRTSSRYRHCLHISLVEREQRIRQLTRTEWELHQGTEQLRIKCMDLLKCKYRGVNTLLGHVVIHMTFSLHTPDYWRIPSTLGAYIYRLRKYLAEYIIMRNTRKPCLLPEWFSITPNDPLHIALLS